MQKDKVTLISGIEIETEFDASKVKLQKSGYRTKYCKRLPHSKYLVAK